jgi:hypothetical protein
MAAPVSRSHTHIHTILVDLVMWTDSTCNANHQSYFNKACSGSFFYSTEAQNIMWGASSKDATLTIKSGIICCLDSDKISKILSVFKFLVSSPLKSQTHECPHRQKRMKWWRSKGCVKYISTQNITNITTVQSCWTPFIVWGVLNIYVAGVCFTPVFRWLVVIILTFLSLYFDINDSGHNQSQNSLNTKLVW